jgi:hypothetical protein
MSPDEYELACKFIESVEVTDYDWSVTLTAQNPLYQIVENRFDEWISQIEEEDGATEWVRVTEPGDGDSFSLHVLIGGRENTHRYKWMLLWEELTGGEARSRFMGESERLRGLLRYFVLRRNFGFKTESRWKPELDIKGWDE